MATLGFSYQNDQKWMPELDAVKRGTDNHTADPRGVLQLTRRLNLAKNSQGKTSAGARTAAPRPSTAPQPSGRFGDIALPKH